MSPTLVPVQHSFGPVISSGSVESLLLQIPADNTPRAVQLDLSACRLIPPGAGWRLGNAMSRWASSGRLQVIVPEPGDFSDRWFLTFTRSGLGISIAQFADEVFAGGFDIAAEVRRYYERAGDISGENYAVALQLDQSPMVQHIDTFADELTRLAVHVRLAIPNLEGYAQVALFAAGFEAVENVLDHAFRQPFDLSPAYSLSYLSLRFHKTIERADIPGADIPGYLERLPGLLPDDRECAGFIELVVDDTGTGVAARHSQNPFIYSEALADERQALRSAFAHAGTVKLEVDDSFVRGEPGFGFSHIVRGLQELKSYAMIRTGRCLATIDGSQPNPDALWNLSEEPFGFMPGTALHILFPLLSDQLQLPANP